MHGHWKKGAKVSILVMMVIIGSSSKFLTYLIICTKAKAFINSILTSGNVEKFPQSVKFIDHKQKLTQFEKEANQSS